MRIPILYAALTLFSSCALALDNGECGTPEQMMKKLKAEDQHTLASANRMEWENNANAMYGVTVTTNTDRSVGYILQSDKELAEQPAKICVYGRLANLRLFDASKNGTPQSALLKASDEDAAQHCDALAKAGKFERKTCAAYNTIIKKREPNGERIMVQGFNVKRQSDGTYERDGTMTTVTGNVNGHLSENSKDPWQGVVSGIFYTSLPDGATIINMVLAFAKYTEYGAKAVSSSPR